MENSSEKIIVSFNSFSPDHVDIDITSTENGLKEVVQKKISFDNFLQLVNRSKRGGESIRIGKVPRGFYDGKINVINNGYSAIILSPGGIFPLQYYDKVYMIPYPNLAFYFEVENGKFQKSKVFAIMDELTQVNDDTVLYYFPFGNVHVNNSICWGGNTFGNTLEKMCDLDVAVGVFYSSPTNNDLWRSSYVNNEFNDLRPLYEFLQGEKIFPQKLLCKTNIKMKDLM